MRERESKDKCTLCDLGSYFITFTITYYNIYDVCERERGSLENPSCLIDDLNGHTICFSISIGVSSLKLTLHVFKSRITCLKKINSHASVTMID